MADNVVQLGVNIDNKRLIDISNGRQAPSGENILRLIAGERPILATTFVNKDGQAVAFGATDTFELNVDIDFVHDATEGTLNSAYSGAVTSIAITFTKDITGIRDTGRLTLQDTSNPSNRESVEYTAVAISGAGNTVGTFTVSKTLVNSYASGDFGAIQDRLMAQATEDDVNTGEWSSASKPGGKISFRLDCREKKFVDKLIAAGVGVAGSGFEGLVYFEIKRYPAGSVIPIVLCQDQVYARRTVRDNEAITIPSDENWTAADARYLNQFANATELTIASGAITPTQNFHTIDTESDGSSDELVTINTTTYSGMLYVRAENAARTVIIKSTGNIETAGADIILDDTNKYAQFWYDSVLAKWVIVGVSSSDIDFNSYAEIGGAIADADEILVNDSGTVKKSLISRVWAYISGKIQAIGFTFDLNMNSNKITALSPGTAGTDAVNKNQLDSVAAAVDHNSTTGKQGGTTSEYYHLTNTEHTRLSPVSAFGATLIDDADQATAQATLGVVPGTDVQVQDAELQAIAGLTSAADKLPYFTGSGTADVTDLTSFSRTLLDDADAATATTTLGSPTGKTNLTTQYRGVFVNSSGEVTESSTIVTDASGNLNVTGDVDISGEIEATTAKIGTGSINASDDFSGSSLDTRRWTRGGSSGATLTVLGGKLKLVGSAIADDQIAVNSISESGDFSCSVDFDLTGGFGTTASICGIYILIGSTTYAVYRRKESGLDVYRFFNGSSNTSVNTTDLTGSLKIERVSGVISAYYGGATQIGSGVSDSGTLTEPKLLWNGTIDIDLDNFVLTGAGSAEIPIAITPGNFSEFEADGTLEFIGDATVHEDININPVNLWRNTGSNPDVITIPGTSLEVCSFDNGTLEEISFGFEMPHSTKLGANLSMHVHWSPTNTNTGVVRWGLEYAWFREDTGAVTTSTTIYANDTASGTAWQRQTAGFADITPPASELGLQFAGRLFRDAANAADTYNADAAITTTFGGHYEIDTVGSRQRLTK